MINNLLIRPEGYSIVAPPGTLADRVEFLRRSIDKAAARPEFKADMQKATGTDIEYRTGEQLTKIVQSLISQKAEFLALSKLTESLAK